LCKYNERSCDEKIRDETLIWWNNTINRWKLNMTRLSTIDDNWKGKCVVLLFFFFCLFVCFVSYEHCWFYCSIMFTMLLVFHWENVWWLCWFCTLVLLNFNQEEMQAKNVDGPNIQSNGRTKYLESRFVWNIFLWFCCFFALRH
jgi:hypothetical protein